MKFISPLIWITIFVATSTAINTRKRVSRQNCPSLDAIQQAAGYRVENYTVHCIVKTRFACTKIFSNITNIGSENKELCFTVNLPEEAFVSNLCMEVDGRKYRGYIEDKEKARILYSQNINSGITVALVESVDGVNQVFNVCASVRSLSSASFTVEYKQRLKMKLGTITHIIPTNQHATLVNVTVYYAEPQGIRGLRSFQGTTSMPEGGSGLFSYIRSQNSQGQNCNSNPDEELVVEYEPVMENSVTTYVANYTFIQFFSPSFSLCHNINLMFVVDVSGSMRGTKIEQVKDFLRYITIDLKTGDYFNIILFNGEVMEYKNSMIRVDTQPKVDARTYIDNNITASGSTNINDALIRGIEQLKTTFQEDRNRVNLLFLISDGRSNSGETDAGQIDRNARDAKGDVPIAIHTFSVGSNANRELLRRLSVYNNGQYQHIPIGNQLSENVRKIYKEVECPLLSDIKFNYPEGSVDQVTINSFPHFYKGQELIVSGILQGDADILSMNITGKIRSGRTITWRRSINIRLANTRENGCLIGKMRAYMEVKDKYFEYELTDSEYLKQEIIRISKENHFVTNLTSLLVYNTSRGVCACPDDCICNTQCPSRSGASPVPVGPSGGSPGPVDPPGGSPGPVGPPGGSPGPYIPYLPVDPPGPYIPYLPVDPPGPYIPYLPVDPPGPYIPYLPVDPPGPYIPYLPVDPPGPYIPYLPVDPPGPYIPYLPVDPPGPYIPYLPVDPPGPYIPYLPVDPPGPPGGPGSSNCEQYNSYRSPGYPSGPDNCNGQKGGGGGGGFPQWNYRRRRTIFPQNINIELKRNRKEQQIISSLSHQECSTQVQDGITVWQNMSRCRGVDNTINDRIIQVRCRSDKIDKCRDYWIRSIDCNTGELNYLFSGETEDRNDKRCVIWYDTGDNSLRCNTQHNMLQNLIELEVSFCPISEDENKDHQEEMELLYDELDPVCNYSDELADCKLA